MRTLEEAQTICSKKLKHNNGLNRIQIVGGNITNSRICRKWLYENLLQKQRCQN